MEHRPLGRTGVKVSSLCLGCMMFGGKTNPDDSIAIIDRAIDAGHQLHRHGQRLQPRPERRGHRQGAETQRQAQPRRAGDEGPRRDGRRRPEHAGNSRRHIIQRARRRCGGCRPTGSTCTRSTGPQSDMPIDETLRALDDLIRAGKVRYIGSEHVRGVAAAWSRCGSQGAADSTASSASSRRTTCWTGASSASWSRWRRRTASRSSPGRRWPAAS